MLRSAVRKATLIGVGLYEEEQDFSEAGDVVVYETAAVGFGELGEVVER